jgi:hypothetical protein
VEKAVHIIDRLPKLLNTLCYRPFEQCKYHAKEFVPSIKYQSIPPSIIIAGSVARVWSLASLSCLQAKDDEDLPAITSFLHPPPPSHTRQLCVVAYHSGVVALSN